MITPIKTMTINQIAEREDDLLMSEDDIEGMVKHVRIKAIDEFAEKLKDSLIHNYRQFLTVDTDGFEWLTTDAVGTHIDEIAEQMKAGGENE